MSFFFGRQTVVADLRLHKQQAGLVDTATLKRNSGFSDVSYTNICLWPTNEITGLGRGSNPDVRATVTAWRLGEADLPRVDDQWSIDSVLWNIVGVRKRLYHDESSGYAIYDCDVVRAG